MKKFIVFIMAAMFSLVINAQTAIQTPKLLDNTYVGINAGVTTPLNMNKAMPLNPTFGIRVGKDFTPVLGLNIEGTTWFGSNLGDLHFGKNVFRAVNIGVNPTINWSNFIKGYNGSPRKLEFISVTGLGWLHTFSGHDNSLSAKTAMDIVWNPSQAWQIYVEPGVFWNLNRYDKIQLNKNRSQLFLNIGVNYKFKTSNGTHNFKLINVGELNDQINSLRKDLAKKPKVVTKTITKEVKSEVIVNNGTYVIMFAKNSDKLSKEAKANLDNIKGNVSVYGYASPEGNANYNMNLSTSRASVVADYLRNKGCTVTEAIGRGVAGETSNRIVIVVNK